MALIQILMLYVLAPTLQAWINQTGVPSRNTSGALMSAPGSSERNQSTSALMERIPSKWPRPELHAPWRNYRVISGHLGWVRSIAFDPSNSWFCTGSADHTIKIWDLGSGRLKLTLTGHIEQVRGIYLAEMKSGSDRTEAAESTLWAYKSTQMYAVDEEMPSHYGRQLRVMFPYKVPIVPSDSD
ncbi:protein pleiotropic regulator PRL2-like isoform X1 [Papaver somniferum]|nr:protein pleiotropic regulator PRL2-like isoform X1 [Papaver somniferum]